MLKYHVAVCDDEKSDLDGIVQSVQQYDVQGCFDIETYMDGNELLSELQMQKKSFDLLLLDIDAIQRFSVGTISDSNGESSLGGICHEAARVCCAGIRYCIPLSC